MTNIDYAPHSFSSVPIETPQATPVLDLQQLRDRCLGNEELVERILDKLEHTLADEMRELHGSLLRADYVALATIAHRLKGTAANVGAELLREVAQQLETFARREQGAETQVCFELLQVEQQRLCEAMLARRPH
jgi:HPt (histidine-containing phosphotransfer) domain-containing protein